jgi:hypothetical protein
VGLQSAKGSSSVCGCIKEEVWLAPPAEVRSPWDGPYITKEMFLNALGLKLIEEMVYYDDAFLHEEMFKPQVDMSKTKVDINGSVVEEELSNYPDSEISELDINVSIEKFSKVDEQT